jgi:hypothetical protein
MHECPFGLSLSKCQFPPTIMPHMVSFQKDIKRYHPVIGHVVLSIAVIVTYMIMCACVRPVRFRVLRFSVHNVISTKWRRASSDIPRAVSVDVPPQLQRRPSQCPSIPPRSNNSSITSRHRARASLSSSDPPFSLFTTWASATTRWRS